MSELQKQRLRERQTTHGMTGTPIFRAWVNMRKRCLNPKHKQYPQYGGRGISVCDEWIASFAAFYADMGDKPFKKAELDRIDNNKGYCKENCRWVDHSTNNRNKRDNVLIDIDGEAKTVAEWSAISGVHYRTLHNRYRNGRAGKALIEPARPKRKKAA